MSAQAIILLGGLGTRLSSLYPDRPKALVPIAGRPFLVWQLEWLRRGGITDIHLAAGHKSDMLADWLRRHEPSGQVTISTEPEPLGTGGGLKYCEPHLRSDPFFVLNGDSLAPRLDFAGMAGEPSDPTTVVRIAVAPIEEAGRFGTVEFDPTYRITAFREKASRSAGWVNAGVYLMGRAVLKRIPALTKVSLEHDVFPALAQEGGIRAFATKPPLLDMGTPDGLQQLERYVVGRPT